MATIIVNTNATPATPAANYSVVYPKADYKWYAKDPSGNERMVCGFDTTGGDVILNGYLSWSVASNNLTVALKTWAGSDPSAADPVYIMFRDATVSTGLPTMLAVTAALSCVVSSGGSLGASNSTAFRVWAVLFNDASTVRLGVINCTTVAAMPGSTTIYPLGAWAIASSTTVGAGSTSAQTFYTNGAGVTSKAYTVLGYATWESGLSTAGTWASGPTRVQLFNPTIPLPGRPVQTARSDTASSSTGTTAMPLDDTIPQNTEGDQYMSQAITPTSAANVLRISSEVYGCGNIANGHMCMALFQDSTANALRAMSQFQGPSSTTTIHNNLGHSMLAGTTSSTTFKIRYGLNTTGTTTFNGANSGRLFGGVADSFLEIQEIMA